MRAWMKPVIVAAMAAAPLHAQPVPPEPTPPETQVGEIEVRAPRTIDKAIVADNIRQLIARIPVFEVVPRFYHPLCLHVIGPDLVANRIIAERITDAALAAGLEKPKPKCRENALVIITDDPDRLFETLVRRRHWAVGDGGRDVSLRRLRDDFTSGKPAISWNRTNMRTGSIDAVMQPGEAPQLVLPRASRIMNSIYRIKALSVIVFDSTRIGAATPAQLGDHAAMHLLTTPNRNIAFGDVSARSILSLFADGPDLAPEGLTAFDRAYIQGVYAVGRDGWRAKVARAALSAYEQECADEKPDCQFLVNEAAE